MPHNRRAHHRLRPLGALAAAAGVLLAAGCGSSGSSASPAGSTPSAGANKEAVSLNSVQAAVAKDYAGTNVAPPASAPAPAAGKKVWVISCGQSSPGCLYVANGALAAGKKLGWDMTLYDGKLGADNGYTTGVKQAIAAKADGIIVGSIDCPLIKQPLTEAKAAGIKTVAILAYDCNDARYGGGPALFTSTVVSNAQNPSTSDYAKSGGAMKADWVLAQTRNKAVAISLTQTDSLLGADIAAGFAARMKQCPSCKVIDVPFTFADISAGQLGAKVSQALQANPTANALTVPYDTLMLLGVAQAVVRSGRSASIAAMGGEGLPPNLSLIKNDKGQDAATFQPDDWSGWAGVDTMVRAFAGQPAAPAGIGLQLLDRAHLPAASADGVINTLDYQSAYLKAWGK